MTTHAPPPASIATLLSDRPPAQGNRPALYSGCAPCITYGDLEERASGLARELERVAGGSLRGERVAIVAPNQPVLPVALLATWLTDAVAVPLSARLREYELRRVLGDAQPAVVVSVAEHGGYSFAQATTAMVEELMGVRGCLIVDGQDGSLEARVGGGADGGPGEVGNRAPGDGERVAVPLLAPGVAALLYTSGTTGEPKGVVVTHACLLAEGESLAGLLDLGPPDVAVLPVPVAHAFGLACLMAALVAGAATALVEPGVSASPVAEAALRHGATVLHGSPALFGALMSSRAEVGKLARAGLVAGASPPPGLIERLDAHGLRTLNLYGMTEIGAACACRSDDPPAVRYETVGRALPGYELRIADGELQVRGPYVTPGYYRRPDLTAQAFAPGGWLRTGDLGSIDEHGNLRLVGRAKELATVGGFNVFPAEVEGLLLTHPDLTQAVVVAVPHAQLGEALKAFVVTRPGVRLEPGDVLRYLRPRIAGYKVPSTVEFVQELPLLASGKPDRAALAGR